MYHKAGVSQLSNTQISRLLNGHGVRVSHGSNHEIELSKEQLKKYMKAHEKGKAITITLDPFQMQNHQFLRGSGSGGSSGGAVGRVNKYNKWLDTLGARPVVEAGMSKAASSISGGAVGRVNKYNKWLDTLGARPVVEAGMSKAASSISGGAVGRRKKFNKWVETLGARPVIDAGMNAATQAITSGGKINRLKKANRWTDYAVGTVNNGIELADKAARVYRKNTQPSVSDLLGFGLKKRMPKKKAMKGASLMPAGY